MSRLLLYVIQIKLRALINKGIDTNDEWTLYKYKLYSPLSFYLILSITN